MGLVGLFKSPLADGLFLELYLLPESLVFEVVSGRVLPLKVRLTQRQDLSVHLVLLIVHQDFDFQLLALQLELRRDLLIDEEVVSTSFLCASRW